MSPCITIHSWTFTFLIGSYLDLAIAYFLLCASTIAYLSSQFLSIFGLYLPCPCNGLFGDPKGHKCLQRLLVDSPISKISNVQLSVKTKFPFDSIWLKGDDHCNSKGETSSEGVFRAPLLLEKRGDGIHGKGKGVVHQRPRVSGVIMRRRKGVGGDSSRTVARDSRVEREMAEEGGSQVTKSGGGYDQGDATRVYLHEYSAELLGESQSIKKDASFGPGLVRNYFKQELGCSPRSDINAIRVLEQALEEEYSARAALYLELDKERSAAASAADEAMAMILRLQKEKASVEMEARQYQRMIEEKSAYDAEEMNILTEILVRREREKLFLEKEVEAYRQMMLFEDEPASSTDMSEDPMLMLQQISESISKKKMVKYAEKYPDTAGQIGCVLDFDKNSGKFLKREDVRRSISIDKQSSRGTDWMDECKEEYQEKGTISMELRPETNSGSSDGSQGLNLLQKTIVFESSNQTNSEIGTSFPCDAPKAEKHENDKEQGDCNQHGSEFEGEPSIHDVYVIDDKSKLIDQVSEKESGQLFMDDTTDSLGANILIEQRSTSREVSEPDTRRSSDMSCGLDKVQGKLLFSNMRRNSMSAVDNERIKLETEVGWLRDRLRVVQEGREKLSFSVEHNERDKVQLELLADIARQLQEIRQLTEPSPVRQASLPPPSKVSIKISYHH
ncbi:hypothetical protein GIB67_013803 [Kingdonia uniflora]|uniref:GTD-binding domain-containing protein n=1 Tax=Kingdonia uniflora TaxID=39325 RepID=A0A7J7N7V3_9MAGN|nr:hypothetical protein GIB67_013803 [Kingdonia uniflora]